MKQLTQSTLLLLLALLSTGLNAQKLKKPKTKFKKLSSKEIYLTNEDNKLITDGRFYFGEKLFVHFDGIVGLKVVEGMISPRFKINVYDSKGNFIFGTKKELINLGEHPSETRDLFVYIELGEPAYSNKIYNATVELQDEYGKGSIKHSFEFRVLRDKKILRNSNGLKFLEVYLFSEERKRVLLEHEVNYNEKVFILIKGLEGFKEKDGLVSIAMEMRIISSENGKILLDQTDMIKDEVPAELVKKSLLAHAHLMSENSKTETTLELLVYDKNNKDHFVQLKTEVLFVKAEE